MARMSQIKAGLDLLLLYGDCAVAAEHDVLYASEVPPAQLTHEERQELERLRWYWDESQDCWFHYT